MLIILFLFISFHYLLAEQILRNITNVTEDVKEIQPIISSATSQTVVEDQQLYNIYNNNTVAASSGTTTEKTDTSESSGKSNYNHTDPKVSVVASAATHHDSVEENDLIEALAYLFSKLQNKERNIRNLLYPEKNYAQLCKGAILKLNVNKSITDLELTRKLILQHKKMVINQDNVTKDVILSVLKCLKYLVHDYENANELALQNSVSDLILHLNNSIEHLLRSEATLLLALAAQNSPKVQMSAVANNVILKILEAISQDSDPSIQIQSIYTLEAIIKKYPSAQLKFMRYNGISILAHFFEKREDNYKMQIKIIIMFHHLLLEHKTTIKSFSPTDMRIKYIYEAVGLEKTLIYYGWCSKILHTLLAQANSDNEEMQTVNLTSAVKEFTERIKRDNEEHINKLDNFPWIDICQEYFNIKYLKQKWFETL